MSYFEDQEAAWEANDCKGSPDEYNPYTDGDGYEPQNDPLGRTLPKRTKSQKRNAQRKRAKERKLQAVGR